MPLRLDFRKSRCQNTPCPGHGKGKELAARKGKLSPAKELDLKPDLNSLVVLPLPHRSREAVAELETKR
jgi:hypothetical protein